jgi:ABC-2 type transport system permease protein
MSAQPNAVPDSPGTQGIAPGVLTATRPFYWSVRRELWENRAIYLAPLAVAGVTLFGSLISSAFLPGKMRALPTLDAAHQHALIVSHYDFAAGAIMVTAMLVGIFYSLDALYGERRDRSILFWKSLPVSDLTTVLSKAVVPIVILQFLAFAITAVTQLIMLLFSTLVLLGNGISVATLWAQVSWFQISLGLFYHLLTVHSLWHAPFYAWFLLVSAWARRAPFLWAFLPPLAICIVERIAFNTAHFAAMLGNRVAGGAEGDAYLGARFAMDPGAHLTPGHFLASSGLWIGLAVTAAFLAAAVRIRRCRGPI